MLQDIQQILQRLQLNEELTQKFFEVELSILSILNYRDLFEKLLTEIREKFQIPYVWITLIDGNEIAYFTREMETSEVLRNRLNLIDRRTFKNLIGNDTKPLLINEGLNPFYKLFPKNERFLVRSLAIAPITLSGEIIGSLNYGDSSGTRYRPGMNTTLLERLAVKVSICLSNVTAHEKLKVAASRDPLTGLLNRRMLHWFLKREFKRAFRYATPLSLVFIDIDGFKNVNDRYGHEAGDALLRYLAHHLVRMTRESDVVARLAGDEFVVILPSTTLEDTQTITHRLRDFLSKHPMKRGKTSIPAQISFGAANILDAGVLDPASLLKRADENLYRAKKSKRQQERVIELTHRV